MKKILPFVAPLLLPALVLAQTFEETLNRIADFLNAIIPFLVLVATVIFLFGVVRYITAGGDEAKTQEGRRLIFWGIVGLAIMIGVWGFVNIVLTFVFQSSDPTSIPGSGQVPQQAR